MVLEVSLANSIINTWSTFRFLNKVLSILSRSAFLWEIHSGLLSNLSRDCWTLKTIWGASMNTEKRPHFCHSCYFLFCRHGPGGIFSRGNCSGDSSPALCIWEADGWLRQVALDLAVGGSHSLASWFRPLVDHFCCIVLVKHSGGPESQSAKLSRYHMSSQ